MPTLVLYLALAPVLTAPPPSQDLQPLFDALWQVESTGRIRVVGDGGRSKGPYQISRAYWKDACQFGGVNWDYDRYVWSRPHCQAVMKWYWQRYGARTDEQRARIHNGGPRGDQTPRTLAYWRKVQREMQ